MDKELLCEQKKNRFSLRLEGLVKSLEQPVSINLADYCMIKKRSF